MRGRLEKGVHATEGPTVYLRRLLQKPRQLVTQQGIKMRKSKKNNFIFLLNVPSCKYERASGGCYSFFAHRDTGLSLTRGSAAHPSSLFGLGFLFLSLPSSLLFFFFLLGLGFLFLCLLLHSIFLSIK